MADDVSLSVGLTGDAEVVAAVERLRKDFNETSVQFAKFMRQSADEAKGFNSELKKTNETMERTGISAVALGTAIGNAITGAFKVAGQFISNAVKANIEWADSVKDMSAATGASVKTIQELTTAARLEGESIGKVEQAFTLLTQKVIAAREGSKSAQAIFDKLEIDPKKFKNAQDAIDQTFAALNKLPEGMAKSEIAADLFGRRLGASMVQIIGATEDARKILADFGMELSTGQVAALDDYKKSLASISVIMEGFGRLIAVELAPVLKVLATEFINAAREAGGFGEIAKTVTQFLRDTIGVGMKAVAMFVALAKSLAIVATAMNEMNWTDFIVPIYGAIKAGNKIKEAFKQFGPEVSASLESAFASAHRIMDGDLPQSAAKSEAAIGGLGNAVEKTAKQVKDVLAPLKSMRDRLMEQTETFGMSESAAAQWKLTHGELGKISGANAEALRREILALTELAAVQKHNKEQAEAVRAAYRKEAEDYDKRQKAQVDFVAKKREETEAFERSVDPIKAYLFEVEKIQEMYQKWGLSTEAAQKAQVKLAEGLQKTLDAADPMKEMFDELIRAVEGFGKKFTENITDFLVEGKLEIGNFAKEVHRLITNMLINTFVTKPIQDWATEMIGILKGSSSQMEGIFGGKINSGFAQSALGGGGGGGGIGGLLGGLFGGGGGAGAGAMELAGGVGGMFFAEGGVLPAGFSGIVGERGPEMITPASRSRITPNGELGGANITINFHDVGNMDVKNQGSLAARAGDAVNRAIRKNR